MGLVFFMEEEKYWWGGNRGSYDLPSEEILSLLEALYIKKKAFKSKASRIVAVDDMIIKHGNEHHVNAVTLCLGSETFFCDEYTYYNSLLAKINKMDFYGRKEFKKKNRNLTLEKYKTFSRPLERGTTKTGNKFVENDTGSCFGSDGYRGDVLNLYGCLTKLLEILPEDTLIERNMITRNGCRNVENKGPFAALFRHCEWVIPHFQLGFSNNRDIDEYAKAEEYEVFCKLVEKIKRLCEKKNIYFDYNAYDSIVMNKTPVKKWLGTGAGGQRYTYTKYKDTFMDGHAEYHEECVAIGIIEERLRSRSTTSSHRDDDDYITEVYDVVYEDGVIGQITRIHKVWEE